MIEYEEEKVKKELSYFTAKKDAKKAQEEMMLEEKVYASIETKKKKYELDWIKLKEDMKHIKEKVDKTDKEAADLKKLIEEQ